MGRGARGGTSVTPEEVEATLQDLHRLRQTPVPADRGSAGCVVSILAILTMVLLPFIGQILSLSGGSMLALGVALALSALVGGVFGIFGDYWLGRGLPGRVAGAIQVLLTEHPNGDTSRRRAAAIRILDRAYVRQGVTTTYAFDVREAARRLGNALPYVEGIEAVLVEHAGIEPVFTVLDESIDQVRTEDPTREG